MHGTLVCCVVHWPLIVFQKVNISPHSAAPQQRWPCMRRRAEHSIYQHHMTYNGAISCSPVRFKGQPVQLSILHSGGRDVWWIRKMLSFFGGQRDVKGSLREGLSIYISMGGAPQTGAFPGSARTIRTEEDVFDKVNLFSVMLNLKIPPQRPSAVVCYPCAVLLWWHDITRAVNVEGANRRWALKMMERTHFEIDQLLTTNLDKR